MRTKIVLALSSKSHDAEFFEDEFPHVLRENMEFLEVRNKMSYVAS